jgi:hypothetical protein
MNIVDNRVSNILAGYDQIRSAEVKLQSKWRASLTDVYAKERELFEYKLENFHQQRAEFRRRIRLGIWLASALFILGLLVLPGLILINQLGDVPGLLVCFSPLLILGGLTGWGIIVVLWFWQRDQVKPTPPRSPLEAGVFYPLYPLWREGLKGGLPNKKSDPTATGELRFLARLQKLDDTSFILYKTHQQQYEMVDIILVGEKGIWLFIVQFLDGLIRWRNGIWTHHPDKPKLFKRANAKRHISLPAFEKKWQNAAESVSQSIQGKAHDLTNEFPQIANVRGGIVFTHPKGRYDIPPGCPFNWGIIPFWLEKLDSISPLPGMDESGIITILDILLTKHQQHVLDFHPKSMVAYADQIILEAEESPRMWIETHQFEENK